MSSRREGKGKTIPIALLGPGQVDGVSGKKPKQIYSLIPACWIKITAKSRAHKGDVLLHHLSQGHTAYSGTRVGGKRKKMRSEDSERKKPPLLTKGVNKTHSHVRGVFQLHINHVAITSASSRQTGGSAHSEDSWLQMP